ncbi:type ISP restriction/modification enzyme [Agrobacterium tumefaciens]|uniref:type ISP restriction/modification enzyme n=1 Tax=Agrobacterium tumefaciens TaxID=358 RepID=UPI002207B218|nr:N-6 DNA methylase [Agrobacterium tumefaciens]UXT84281.1 N-6 DNA methylase [Agrobacterium tumefaciens]
MKAVADYLRDVARKFEKGNATEHTYREALGKLSGELLADEFELTNEPKRQQCGAPDYILEKSDVPVGFIEAKVINTPLDKVETGEQMRRYLKSLDNLILTDYLEFRFYRKGVKVNTLHLGSVKNGKVFASEDDVEAFCSAYRDFSTYQTRTIKNARQLAEMMASKAVLVKDVFRRILASEEESSLHNQYKSFRQVLLHDVTAEEFADIYAETLAYGLFTARLHDTTLDTFTRGEAYALIPRSNPFLRDLFAYIGTALDERAEWIVDALCDVFRATDVNSMLKTFNRGTGRTDPFLHFYETFLSKYNPKKKKARGVWYTPEPVVNFIVRAVDDVLKQQFNLPDGLADTSKVKIKVDAQSGTVKGKQAKSSTVKVEREVHKVQILDVATGTGTFLAEVIAQIYAKKKAQQGTWTGYVNDHLIPRLHGFELIMASYAMCHMKLEILLRETQYNPKGATPPRLNVYLTNTLQKPDEEVDKLPLIDWFTRESNEASYIKKNTPIMVAIGNPPYSGVSSNMGELIVDIEDYKYVDGVHFNEKKHWLHDDYVKFIRLGEHFVEKNKEGVLGYITNHSYLDNPTFRGMRWHLLNTFDRIYVIDLHGNANKKEKNPDGTPDKNVFDIRQGVSILIGVRTTTKAKTGLAEVFHAEAWGSRNSKYEMLGNNSLSSIKWKKLETKKPFFYFVPKDTKGRAEYDKGFAINEIFKSNITGIVTMGDGFIVDDHKDVLKKRLKKFVDSEFTEEQLKSQYDLGKNYARWILETKPSLKIDDSKFVPLNYRPFDNRYTYFDNKVIWRWREKVMKHFVSGENVGLIVPKNTHGTPGGIATRHVAAHKTYDAYNINNVFPLYLMETKGSLLNKVPNFNNTVWKKIRSVAASAKDPEAVFDYVYGTLYTPSYRNKYAIFFKDNFPRIPYPKDDKHFLAVAKVGAKLRSLHLLESPDCVPDDKTAAFTIDGSHVVEKVEYKDGRVWINDEEYFDNVPKEAWESRFGGYDPAKKWLADRKDTELDTDQIEHYRKIIGTLIETTKHMATLDKI